MGKAVKQRREEWVSYLQQLSNLLLLEIRAIGHGGHAALARKEPRRLLLSR